MSHLVPFKPRAFQSEKVPRPPQSLPFFDWPKNKNIIIDIGCGNGESSFLLAQENPNSLVFGLERTQNRFEQFNLKLSRYHPTNLFAIRTDAIAWITHFVPLESVNKYCLYYPNPYPKSRQANMRWHNHAFSEHLLKTLKQNGDLVMRTNIFSYAEEAKNSYQQVWGLKLFSERSITQASIKEEPIRSSFEKKYLARGELCYELHFKKVSKT
jgi:tRNA (guanine-N(7)-)-methyltransferase